MKQMLVAAFLILLAPWAAWGAEWDEITTENFAFLYPPGQRAAAQRLADQAEELRKKTLQMIGVDFKERTRVYLAPDRETYESIQPRSIVPEWSVGVAFPDSNLIIVYTPQAARELGHDYNMVQVFHHEFCHVALGMAIRDVKVPRWLEEGFAQYQAGEWTAGNSFRMTIAYLTGSLIPLNDLMHSWPKGEGRARLAYMESFGFVAFLHRTGRLPRIIRLMSQGVPAETAVYRATGYSTSVLEKRWSRYMQRRHTWLALIMRPDFIWSSMAVLFLVVYLIVRRRMKKKYRLMELEEEYERIGSDDRTFH